MKAGARGKKVRQLQARLNELSFGPLEVDGVFGPATASAVRLFQGAERLEVDGIAGPRTMEALDTRPTGTSSQEPAILQVLRQKGYEVFTGGDINTIGVRSVPGVPNRFDDKMHFVWWCRNHWEHKVVACTTDPGTYWIENPMNVDGAATLEPGQYVRAYKFDKHRGKYMALCQRGAEVKFRRTDTPDELESDYIGANIHHAGENFSEYVNRWSACCQVIQKIEDWDMAMGIWLASQQKWFTYTLLLSTDL